MQSAIRKKINEFLDLTKDRLDKGQGQALTFSWDQVGKWIKVHNGASSQTGGDYKLGCMLDSSGHYKVGVFTLKNKMILPPPLAYVSYNNQPSNEADQQKTIIDDLKAAVAVA
jgi:hypothetical protein